MHHHLITVQSHVHLISETLHGTRGHHIIWLPNCQGCHYQTSLLCISGYSERRPPVTDANTTDIPVYYPKLPSVCERRTRKSSTITPR